MIVIHCPRGFRPRTHGTNHAIVVSRVRKQLEGQTVRITEVQIPDDGGLVDRLTDMRVWLDNLRFKPSTFTDFFLDPGMKIRVSFRVAEEAEAFAQEFRGTLLDTPCQLIGS